MDYIIKKRKLNRIRSFIYNLVISKGKREKSKPFKQVRMKEFNVTREKQFGHFGGKLSFR